MDAISQVGPVRYNNSTEASMAGIEQALWELVTAVEANTAMLERVLAHTGKAKKQAPKVKA